MAKKQQKQNAIQQLDEKLQKLMDTRLKAYTCNASGPIIEQIENLIAQTQLDLYTETELARHRNSGKEDGEEWIV